MDIIPVCEDSYGTVCTCITDGVIGADLAVGRAGSSPPIASVSIEPLL